MIPLLVNIVNCLLCTNFILDQKNIIYAFYELCILRMSNKNSIYFKEQFFSHYTHEKNFDIQLIYIHVKEYSQYLRFFLLYFSWFKVIIGRKKTHQRKL